MAEKTTSPATGDLVIERVFDAPRELVWRAWTEPEHFMRWWGPKGFTTPVANVDFRVGGRTLTCMRSEDGQDIWSVGVCKEIVPGERFVVTTAFADEKGNLVPASTYGMPFDIGEMTVTVILEDLGGKTKLTLRHAGLPDAENQLGANEGWSSSFDKLDELLAQLQ